MRVPGIDASTQSHIEAVLLYVRNILSTAEWSALSDLVSSISIHPHAYRLSFPALVARAGGYDFKRLIPLNAAWILLLLAASLFDDLQDGDRDDVAWNEWSSDEVMNMGLGLLFCAQLCLARQEAEMGIYQKLHEVFATAGMLAAQGQLITVGSVEDYFRRIYAISGAVFCAGAEATAYLFTGAQHTITNLRDFGIALGTLIQIRDDASDTNSILFKIFENLGIESDYEKNVDILIEQYAVKAIRALELSNLYDITDLRNYVEYVSFLNLPYDS